MIYPLVIEHSHGKWPMKMPIEIDGLPIKMVDLSMAMLNNQMIENPSFAPGQSL
jgi:hypothetical protein